MYLLKNISQYKELYITIDYDLLLWSYCSVKITHEKTPQVPDNFNSWVILQTCGIILVLYDTKQIENMTFKILFYYKYFFLFFTRFNLLVHPEHVIFCYHTSIGSWFRDKDLTSNLIFRQVSKMYHIFCFRILLNLLSFHA